MKAEEHEGLDDMGCERTITVDTLSEDDDEELDQDEDEDTDHRSEEEGTEDMQTEQHPKNVDSSPQKPHNLHHLNRWRVETNQLA